MNSIKCTLAEPMVENHQTVQNTTSGWPVTTSFTVKSMPRPMRNVQASEFYPNNGQSSNLFVRKLFNKALKNPWVLNQIQSLPMPWDFGTLNLQWGKYFEKTGNFVPIADSELFTFDEMCAKVANSDNQNAIYVVILPTVTVNGNFKVFANNHPYPLPMQSVSQNPLPKLDPVQKPEPKANDDLEKDQEQSESNIDEPFQCTYCGKTSKRKFTLMVHIKHMHGVVYGSSIIDRRLTKDFIRTL